MYYTLAELTDKHELTVEEAENGIIVTGNPELDEEEVNAILFENNVKEMIEHTTRSNSTRFFTYCFAKDHYTRRYYCVS